MQKKLVCKIVVEDISESRWVNNIDVQKVILAGMRLDVLYHVSELESHLNNTSHCLEPQLILEVMDV